MSNTDSWTKENGKIKLVIAQYCTYQERIQFCYLKIFFQSLTKTWYSSKKHAENMKTFQREKTWKTSKIPSCMPANFKFSLSKKKRIHIKTIFIKISAISKLLTNMKMLY